MDDRLSLPERSALLALVTFLDEASNTDIAGRYGFTIDKTVRVRLEGLGYLTSRRGTAPGKPYVHELTDLGARRVRDELAATTPDGAPRAYRLMYGLFPYLDGFMRGAKVELADIFRDHDESVDPEPATDVEGRIRETYGVLAAEPAAWVNLNRVRGALADLSRHDVDQALLRLDLRPRVYLIPESNQKTLTDTCVGFGSACNSTVATSS
ncbi:MAG: hypothetical protein M3548_14765 [Actinomycetota bacterium]|nr:hypothetical protein [Actinomycetota bacterium]